MSKKQTKLKNQTKKRIKQKAKEIHSYYQFDRQGSSVTREDLEHVLGLSRDQATRVWAYIVEAEKGPLQEHFMSEESGTWRWVHLDLEKIQALLV